MRHPPANSATGAAFLADSNVEASEVDRLLTEFMNFFFFSKKGPPGLERRGSVGKRPVLLSNSSRSWREIDWLGASEPSKDGKKASPRFSRRSLTPTRRNAVTQTLEFPGTAGGWSPKLGDIVVSSDRHREKQNWRGGRHGSVMTRNDVEGWSRCSRGFSNDSHETSFCQT